MGLEGHYDNGPPRVGCKQAGLREELLVGTVHAIEVADREHRLLEGRLELLQTVQYLHLLTPLAWQTLDNGPIRIGILCG
jgi:hypothetical protein